VGDGIFYTSLVTLGGGSIARTETYLGRLLFRLSGWRDMPGNAWKSVRSALGTCASRLATLPTLPPLFAIYNLLDQ
jgi:hypothetical protein